MFKSVFIKKFRIIFICFCFIQNKCYSEDCCEICYNCCCNCLNSKNKETSVFDNTNKEKSHTYKNKKLEKNSEKEEEEEENNENEENEVGEDLGYKYKKQVNKGNNKLNTIFEKKEKNEEKEESEKKEKNEEKEESEKKEKNEENEEENEEKALNDYLKSVFKKFKRIKPIEDDFFKAQETYVLKKRGTKKNDGILGEGGFGQVYKIKNKKNEKTFVLKKSVVKEEEDLEDIKNEIRNLIRFRDEKNILRIVDVYRQDNFVGKFLKKKYSEKDKAVCFYIITEYCKNGDLYDFIKHKKILDKENLRDKIAYQIINAVHSCHKEKIAHRDLKPLNIFLDKDWNVKLGDFGLSKKFSENEKDNEIAYTENFACYEILLEKKHDPFKADLYSLGVTLFVLYTGKNLLKVNTKMEKEEIKEKFNAIPTTIDDFISDSNLKNLLKNLLERKEEDRCGWEEILKSKFYKSLKKKFEKN